MEDANDGIENNEHGGMEIEPEDNETVETPATALLEAVCINDLESCRTLIASGVDINEVSGIPERTALIRAAQYGQREIVELLIKAGADVSAQADEGLAVTNQLKKMKINDVFSQNGYVREDGRMVHDMFLVQVKSPKESKGPWDYYKVLDTVAGETAFQPLAKSSCYLVKK